MAATAPRYDLSKFLPSASPRYAAQDAHALLAIAGLDIPVTYDRDQKASVDGSPSDGVALRGGKLVLVHDGIVRADVMRDKSSHVKHATVTVTGGARDLLRDVHPGDWAMLWLMPDRPTFDDVLDRVKKGDPANKPGDGLRMVARVQSVRARGTIQNGIKSISYTIQLAGFAEFDSQLYYDLNLATNDVLQAKVGGWLTRVGVDADDWFARHATDDRADNINTILPDLLELVLGRGVSQDLNSAAQANLAGAFGAGAEGGAPNAYACPTIIAKLLGVDPGGGVVAYAELLSAQVGLQSYDSGNDLKAMIPNLSDDLQGAFYPFFPQMINTPFWSVLGQFLNPSINEMYTALKLADTDDGPGVYPAFVVRQIPFTTQAYGGDAKATPFLSVPRWVVPSSLMLDYDLGRSDATRVNMVHVYASALQFAGANSQSKQMVENPIIHDDLDIQRSGPRPLMLTVECAIDDNKSAAAGKWSELIADWSMGQHLTMNGTIQFVGLPGPMPEGDNVEIDGMVFHLEGIVDTYHVQPDGKKFWRTLLKVTNGVLAEADDDLHYYGTPTDSDTTLVPAFLSPDAAPAALTVGVPGVTTLARNEE